MESDNEILITITKKDLQEEANNYLGRQLDEDEYLRAKKLFEFGMGENIHLIYWGAFSEFLNNK